LIVNFNSKLIMEKERQEQEETMRTALNLRFNAIRCTAFFITRNEQSHVHR